ncbi:DUF6607 family protein [Aliiglaciecola sp. NS0011-25]|uniref:DUF6607 family protein n=1 Tax=Aliiglaciecola sp. NS0011-25 TaxID=3127654 RepID=UPI003107CF0D
MKNSQTSSFIHKFALLFVFIMLAFKANADSGKDDKNTNCDLQSQFTFSWSFNENCDFKPRGGSSKGVPIMLDPEPHPGWLSLQQEGISEYEKDRRAILAMAGPYRVSFDFLETVGFTPDYSPSRPYQSWGTEYVYVAEDKGDFISLQHVMVMYFIQDDGSISEPMVMKHWRQDWQFQKRDLFVYAGNHKWQHKKYNRKTVKGTWSQSVFQVDDSPRYESFGKWQHNDNFSTWLSAKTWRPLPRRESSVRNDYQVLEGTNRHTILPSGWVQEEENVKLVLDSDGKAAAQTPYLAKELGLARYERIIDHDFSEGDKYWQKSEPFWSDVREVWRKTIDENDSLIIHKTVDDNYMFMPFFNEAQNIVDGQTYQTNTGKAQIKKMLSPFIEVE